MVPAPTTTQPDPPAEFRLLHQFGPNAGFYPLDQGDGLLICDDCSVSYGTPAHHGLVRRLFLFDGTELRDLPPLLDDEVTKAIGQVALTEAVEKVVDYRYLFVGRYPQPLYVQLTGEPPSSYQWVPPWFVLSNESGAWKLLQGPNLGLSDTSQSNDGVTSFQLEYADALLHAPELHGLFLAGGNGPLLLLTDDAVHRWDGQAWQEQPASWERPGLARRLDDGRSLVLTSRGAFMIDARGIPTQRPVVPLAGEPIRGREDDRLRLNVVRGTPYLSTAGALWAPKEPHIRIVERPTQTPRKRRSDVPRGARGVPPRRDFDATCKTPFVTLSRIDPKDFSWWMQSHSYFARRLADAWQMQDALEFAEFARGADVYFGFQARDEQTARAVMEVFGKSGASAEMHLGCWDMVSYVPDAYQPKWDAERALLNLRAHDAI